MDRERCFNECIDRHLPMLRSVAYRIVGNCADADEAIQQSMFAAWRRFDTFRGQSQMSSWIYRITVNESYNILRKRRRESEKIAEYAKQAGDMESDSDDPQLRRLEKEIGRLPELYRAAIQIGVLTGLDGAVAAERLGCSANTLYQRIFKAKALLRKAMREASDEDE